MDKRNKWDKWNEEDYEYGYLVERCECGEPVWLKGDKCNIYDILQYE